MSGGIPVPRQGEIWLVFTPGRPYDPHQPRPALVISEDRRNQRTDHLLVVPIFSAGRLGPTRIPIPADTGGIAHDSVIFCEEISTIDREFLVDGPPGPTVPQSMIERIIRSVRRALGEVVPEP